MIASPSSYGRAFYSITGIENLHNKYAVTAKEIKAHRDAAARKMKGFFKELGYE